MRTIRFRNELANGAHLWRRIAWRFGARAEGELSERARARAAELAENTNLSLRAPGPFWDKLESLSGTSDARRDLRCQAVGTVLRRVYRGTPVVVELRYGRRVLILKMLDSF